VLIINRHLRVKLDRDQAPSSLPPVSIWPSLYRVCASEALIVHRAVHENCTACATTHSGASVSNISEIQVGNECK
jgi:hypothetical protein